MKVGNSEFKVATKVYEKVKHDIKKNTRWGYGTTVH
jgi:hypothetical protein